MSDYRRTLEEILKRHGWSPDPSRKRWNCHEILVHPDASNKIALPNKVDDRNLARRVLRQAGIRGVHPL
jgi:hypothetical protein